MRRPIKKKFDNSKPDSVFKNAKVTKLINYIMHDGKKNLARGIVYGALEDIKEKTKKDSIEIFEEALKNSGPTVEVRSRRIGGANYQVPREVRPDRRLALSLRWIIEAARSKKGKPMRESLAEELISASKNEGEAVKKRENVHKMADANKAFAHFSW